MDRCLSFRARGCEHGNLFYHSEIGVLYSHHSTTPLHTTLEAVNIEFSGLEQVCLMTRYLIGLGAGRLAVPELNRVSY